MTFTDAIKTVLTQKYLEFSGRAARSEYWWFFLFAFIVNILVSSTGVALLSGLVSLALLIPGIAVGIRRLHDIGKSGWWLLIFLIPIVNLIMLLLWFTRKGTPGPNEFGADPLAV